MSAPKEKQNIVIIGGGIIGCTTAYYLTHHPNFIPSVHSVTLIEATKIANGASGKAGGLLAAWANPSSLARLSFDLHDQLAREHDGAERWGYRRVRCGQLTAIVSQRADTSRQESSSHPNIDLGKWWGRDVKKSSVLPDDLDWFDPQSAQSYEEFADTSSTAQVHPFQFTNAMAKLAEQSGAKIIMGKVECINCCDADGASQITSPLTSSSDLTQKRVVSVTYTDKATSKTLTLPATTVVLAAGPWTPTLFPKVRIQPLRAHSVTMKLQRPVSAYCLFSDIRISDSRPTGKAAVKAISLEIYARPNNEVYICGQGDREVPLPPTNSAVEVSSDRCQDIINAAMSVSAELRDGKVTGRRACYLPTLDAGASSDPLVGQTDLPGLVLATGHSCWGISNAPATGKAVSELIIDGKVSCMDMANLDARRIR
ncbi:FAD dependent oxidoreductase [Hyaloscypha variabilis]